MHNINLCIIQIPDIGMVKKERIFWAFQKFIGIYFELLIKGGMCLIFIPDIKSHYDLAE